MDSRSRYDLVCIGSGPAGEKAALMAATAGKRVLIVERESAPGGAMVNTGTIASKVLRETALLCSAFRRRPIPGVGFALDRDISLRRFMARKTLVQIEEHDRIERSIDRHGIDVQRGTGRIVRDHAIEIEMMDGTKRIVECDHVLVATGSRPFRPSNVDFSQRSIVDADGLLDIERMPRSMIVVGGGVIGTEYACIFAEMGVDMTIIEPRDSLMPFLDHEVRDALLAQLTNLGIRTVFSCAVDEIKGNDAVATVTLKNGRAFSAETVLWALGRIGNTNGIGLESVGIAPDNRGLLKVDSNYRTSADCRRDYPAAARMPSGAHYTR